MGVDKNSSSPSPFPRAPLSLSSCATFPGAARCKDTFTKGRPLLCYPRYRVRVTGDGIFQISLFVTLTFKCLDSLPPSPRPGRKRRHFRSMGKWVRVTLCHLLAALNGFLTSAVPSSRGLNRSLKWTFWVVFFFAQVGEAGSATAD